MSQVRAVLVRSALAVALCSPWSGAQTIHDDTGLNALIQRLGAGHQPTGAGVIVGQVEALAGGYRPDPAHPEFAGKTFTLKSPAGGISGHATVVGQHYYGLSTSIAPGIDQIECWEASNWIAGGYINGTGSTPPDVGDFKVLNHFWIGSGAGPEKVLRKLDHAIETQGFIACVGVNNGTGPLDVPMLSHGFNLIAVGRSDGQHHAGTTGLGVDGPGRQKPEIVAPASATSFSTPLIGGAAALLVETARTHPALASNAAAERPDVIKAALLAGATHRSGWTNNPVSSGVLRGSTTTPLDALWGVDQVDVNRSHWILTGGEVDASATAAAAQPARHAGWCAASLGSGDSRWWRFDVEASKPFVSVLATWHRHLDATFTANYELPDLDLELWRVDASGNVQSLVGDGGLSSFAAGDVQSQSAVDNLEHLYVQDLAPGSYALELRRTPDAFGTWTAALAWHLECPAPQGYGTGKTSSQGLEPKLSWRGVPNVAAGEFALEVRDAVPGMVGIAFWGNGQTSLPFYGGTLLVQPPIHRLPSVVLDAAGGALVPVPLSAPMVGDTRNYQFWFRDPSHPDGTGAGLTSAVEAKFCF